MKPKMSKSDEGFTLIEVMIVLFIVGILSAVAASNMKGRNDAAKWTEAKAAAGEIRIAARAYYGQKGDGCDFTGTTLENIGFVITPAAGNGDLDGKYFSDDCYSIEFLKNGDFLITVNAAKSTSGERPVSPRQITLDSAGVLTEMP